MKKLTPDQLAAVGGRPLSTSPAARLPLFVLCDNIRSLYNVGSIFRTSDAVGITRLILTGYTPVPPRKEIEKTALGATATVPWEYRKDPLQVLEELAAQNIRIVCLERTDESVPYTALTRNDLPACLILGNEVTGVSTPLVSRSDKSIAIPMRGLKHSLNVSVAYGVAAFEFLRVWASQDGQMSNDFV